LHALKAAELLRWTLEADSNGKGKIISVPNEKIQINTDADDRPLSKKVKFEVYGEEMIEKDVKMSGNSGRVYLPPDWVGHRIKIIRVD
jgi:putative transposon-encoded protein